LPFYISDNTTLNELFAVLYIILNLKQYSGIGYIFCCSNVAVICTAVYKTVLTCCTISLTLIHQLRPTILHNIQTPTTAVSLLQLVNGEYLIVTSYTMLSASQTRLQVFWKPVYIRLFYVFF